MFPSLTKQFLLLSPRQQHDSPPRCTVAASSAASFPEQFYPLSVYPRFRGDSVGDVVGSRGIPISKGDVSSQLAGLLSRARPRRLANWKFINELNYRIRYFYRAAANV